MTRTAGTWFRSFVLATLATVPLAAQTPPAPTTAVLASLTIKPDADRSQLPAVLPSEVRETVKLYLDGKIQQWYARADGLGVIFILNVSSVADAKALMESLPLAKAHIATFEYTPLTPLTPLRLLVAEPGASARGNRER